MRCTVDDTISTNISLSVLSKNQKIRDGIRVFGFFNHLCQQMGGVIHQGNFFLCRTCRKQKKDDQEEKIRKDDFFPIFHISRDTSRLCLNPFPFLGDSSYSEQVL